MLKLKCSTRNLKCNLLLNSNFNQFLRFHCPIHNTAQITICKFPSKWRKSLNLQHFRRQSNPFPVFGQPGQFNMQQKEREYLAIRPERGPFEPVALHTEKLEYSYIVGNGNRLKNTIFISLMENTNVGRTKYIQLAMKIPAGISFPNIPVPEDAYLFLEAMDRILNKSVDEEKPPICQELVMGGLHYDYKLEISTNRYGFLAFWMHTITTEAKPYHKPRQIHIPILLLPLLRDRMAEMLEKYDRTEEIESLPYRPLWIQGNDDQVTLENSNQEELFRRQKSIEYNDVEYRSRWTPKNDTFDRTTISENAYERTPKRIRIERMEYSVDVEPKRRQFMIELREGISGNRFIKLTQRPLSDMEFKNNRVYLYFSSIPWPEDAYPLVNAMRTLSNDLREMYATGIRQNDSTLICHQMVNGLLFDYQLEIHIRRNQQLDFRMRTITTDASPNYRPRYLEGPIPINVFEWLQKRMAKMLMEFDGTQQIESRPSPLPKKWKGTTTTAENDSREGKTIQSKALRYIVGVEPWDRLIEIELRQGISGRKFIEITQRALKDQTFKGGRIYCYFPNISVPEDAYPLLKAMCDLDDDFQLNQSLATISPNNSSLICRQMVTGGCFYDYLLEIRQNRNQQFEFDFKTITTDIRPTHRPRHLEGPVPIDVFHWLKDEMTEMLLIDCLVEQQEL